jgi:hypothetical protein
MKSRSFSESHSIPYNKFRALGFLEAPLMVSQPRLGHQIGLADPTIDAAGAQLFPAKRKK